ncbi:MAG TPA: winged helix DNA-binding domain-containing protein [Acidimicrobiales bacterium]|nr:winged helix DNA-binding domain-containing protein [Acidimicrobiales bacterium]
MPGNERPLRTIGAAERRARLAIRHRLAPGWHAANVVEVARDVVGLLADDMAAAHLSACARLIRPSVEAMARALHDDRVLVPLPGRRGTLLVVPTYLAPVIHAACARTVADGERRRLVDQVRQSGLVAAADAAVWLDRLGDRTVAALERRGEALPGELAADLPELALGLPTGPTVPASARDSVGRRLLALLEADGRVVRARPRRGWTSTGRRWVPMSRWLGDATAPLPAPEARAALARRWLASFGPATADDLAWWAGWAADTTRAALAGAGTVTVDLDGTPGHVLADDVDPAPAVGPWVALLPALDCTTMGWRARDWYVDPALRPALFDRRGNAGPTVWCDGRVVGGWAQRRDGEVAVRLLSDVGGEAAGEVGIRAASLAAWLGAARVTPRYRTPLERELAA